MTGICLAPSRLPHKMQFPKKTEWFNTEIHSHQRSGEFLQPIYTTITFVEGDGRMQGQTFSPINVKQSAYPPISKLVPLGNFNFLSIPLRSAKVPVSPSFLISSYDPLYGLLIYTHFSVLECDKQGNMVSILVIRLHLFILKLTTQLNQEIKLWVLNKDKEHLILD